MKEKVITKIILAGPAGKKLEAKLKIPAQDFAADDFFYDESTSAIESLMKKAGIYKTFKEMCSGHYNSYIIDIQHMLLQYEDKEDEIDIFEDGKWIFSAEYIYRSI